MSKLKYQRSIELICPCGCDTKLHILVGGDTSMFKQHGELLIGIKPKGKHIIDGFVINKRILKELNEAFNKNE